MNFKEAEAIWNGDLNGAFRSHLERLLSQIVDWSKADPADCRDVFKMSFSPHLEKLESLFCCLSVDVTNLH